MSYYDYKIGLVIEVPHCIKDSNITAIKGNNITAIKVVILQIVIKIKVLYIKLAKL